MNVDTCTSLPITAAMSRLDLGIGVSLPGPLRRASQGQSPPRADRARRRWRRRLDRGVWHRWC
jgi:hypothetical protein